MSLTVKQLVFLRGEAHRRKPVVTIGRAGLTPAVLQEIDLALAHHELIKIKLPAGERAGREQLLDELCARSGAEAVQCIGRIGVAYRRADKPRIQLPG